MADAYNRDHLQWLRQIATDPALTPFCTRLAVVLTGYFNRKTGSAFPSQETLAADLGATVDGVRKATIQLERGGHLIVTRRCGRHLPSLYAPALKPQTAVGGIDGETPDSGRGNEAGTVNETPDSRLRNPRQPSEKPQTAVGTNPLSNPLKKPPEREARERAVRKTKLPTKAKASKSTLSANWSPPLDAYEIGEAVGLTANEVEMQTETFRRWHRAHGVERVDWSEAYRLWLAKEATRKADRQAAAPQGARHGFSGMDHALGRIA
ncbi:hypothetical protein MCEMIH16_01350 [Caulobacteraceae bacterium]